MIDPQDVAAAVRYLEQTIDPKTTTYELSRITNPLHAVSPRGEGFGVMVTFWYDEPYILGQRRQLFWEKAGNGVLVESAAVRCIVRLADFKRTLEPWKCRACHYVNTWQLKRCPNCDHERPTTREIR